MLPNFASLLRDILKRKGLSQRGFAEQVTASYSFVNKVACGHTAAGDGAEEWADALELTGDEREVFLDSAALTMAPARVKAYVANLEAQLETKG